MLFGEIAVEHGFATVTQLKHVLETQRDLKERGEHKLIGLIFVEFGYLDAAKIETILKLSEKVKDTLESWEDDDTAFIDPRAM